MSAGFGPADQQRLTDARDGLLAAGVQRTSAKAGKTQQRTAHGATVSTGKTERASARSILGGARRELLEASDPASDAAVKLIDAALATTSSSGGDLTELGNQLALLRDALTNATVAAAAAGRGGPAAAQALAAALQSIQASSKPAKRGTPEETERLNVFDGLIVELARAARKAARVAARKAGTPALGAAFALLVDAAGGAPAAAPVAPPPGGSPPA